MVMLPSALILPDEDEVSAVRFDALMYGIELAHLAEKQSKRRIKDLLKKINFILLYSFLGISFTVVNFRRQIILESKKRS